ncbi:ubiquitin-like modifier 1 [Lasallia pustulata]|uniref:Ubiquitin-related modifier 1 n=1 Tax=Lasallia pustulata TaxID=136370 RepID=A0A1W5CY17_9LECA|nr:ubiquitin-like modifier 1 [Lasallia pustulata]
MDITPCRFGTSDQSLETIPIAVEFSGGLELLFSNQRKHQISLPTKDEDGQTANVAFLVQYLCQHLMKDRRKELFVMGGTVRPGILVLINDADWELEGENSYELQNGDNVLFVSTLHGG